MDWTLEVVILPVSDIDRAIEFYRDRVGFDLEKRLLSEVGRPRTELQARRSWPETVRPWRRCRARP